MDIINMTANKGVKSAHLRGTDCVVTKNTRRPVCRTVVLTLSAFALLTTAARAVDTYTYVGTNGTWLTGTNWSGGVSSDFPGAIARSNTAHGTTTDIAIFGSALTGTSSNTIGINMGTSTSGANGSLTLGTIEIAGSTNSPSGPVIINNSSTTLDGVVTLTGNTINNVGSTILDNESTKLLTISNGSSNALGVGLGATTNVVQINGSGGITISSIISGSAKNLTFQGTGSGTLTLSGVNTYTGGTTINGGAMVVSSTGTLGDVSGALAVNDTNTGAATAVSLTLNSAQTVSALSGTTATASSGTNTSTITLTGTSTILTDNQSTTTTFDGIIAGTGGLTKSGTGTLNLTNTSTYTGPTIINGGTIAVNGGNRIGSASGSLTINNGTFQLTTIGGAGSSVSSGRNIVLGNASSTFSVDASLTYTSTSVAVISGAGTLNKSGAGTLTLQGADTYNGGTSISAGTLQFAKTGSLPSTGSVAVTGTGTFAVNAGGTNEFTNGTTGVGTIGGAFSGATFTGASTSFGIDTSNAGGNLAYAGTFSGAQGLTKLGTGALTLTTANTYTGATTVSGGTLLVNSNQTSATGSVNVASGGTLGGTGTIGGATNVASGGTITGATNGTIGTLSFTNALTINGTYVADISNSTNTSDSLSLTGMGTNGVLNVTGATLTLNGTISAGISYVLATYASITGTFSNVNFKGGALPPGEYLVYGTNSLTLVPEPGTWAGGLLLLGTFGFSQRRRLKRGFSLEQVA